MSETELLEIDIEDIKAGMCDLENAVNNLSDIEEFEDEDYNYLQDLIEKLRDIRVDKENKLEILED